jgi:hypothetical protein
MDVLELPVPVLNIWNLLRDFSGGSPRGAPWSECLSLARGTNVIGELHLSEVAQASDFKDVLLGRRLRVVMMPEGKKFIMRWADPGNERMKEILGGIYHDDLVHSGDQFEAIRSGWVMIPSVGYLTIS